LIHPLEQTLRLIELEDLDFGALVRPGDIVTWNMGCGEPLSLSRRLMTQRHAVGGVFKLVLGTIYSDTVRPEHCDVVRVISVAGSGPSRKLADAGQLDILPVSVSEFAGLIHTRRLPVDVALVQLAEHPVTGELSFGASNACGPDLLHSARTVIAEINVQAPFTASSVPVERERITFAVRTDVPMVELRERGGDARDAQIAAHVASLVPDGGVLQIGMGSLPRAVLKALRGHRDLGVLSGGMGDDCVDLIEAGVMTNARKKTDAGISVAGLLLGTRKTYEFAHCNPAIRIDPVSYTHDINVLGACDRLMAINSAIEIDLSGQANGEVAGGKYLGAVGGQAEFMRGAKAANGGLAILALSSTASAGQSRIVARIPSGIVSTSRADIDCVVTEFGIAHLRACALSERARRLIAIAHPDHREALERAARDEPGSALRRRE